MVRKPPRKRSPRKGLQVRILSLPFFIALGVSGGGKGLDTAPGLRLGLEVMSCQQLAAKLPKNSRKPMGKENVSYQRQNTHHYKLLLSAYRQKPLISSPNRALSTK